MSKLPINEQLLIDLLYTSNRQAFAFLHETYSPVLHGHLIDLIEDKDIAAKVLQKAFVAAYFTISDCKRRRQKLYTWMLHITLRLVIQTAQVIESWPTASQLQALSGGMSSVLDTMDVGPREVIRLIYDKGYSKAKAASLLKLPIYRIDEMLQTGLQQLQQYVNNCNEHELIKTQCYGDSDRALHEQKSLIQQGEQNPSPSWPLQYRDSNRGS